ncbi:MAG: hypothetical protein R6X12_07935 [bacterium]
MAEHDSEGGRSGPGGDVLILSAVGYLPMLFFVPLVACRGDDYAHFHGRQSLALLLTFVAASLVVWLVGLVFGRVLGDIVLLGFIFRALAWLARNVVGSLVSLAYIGLVIAGIINATLGRKWQVPVIGAHLHFLAGPQNPDNGR